MQDYSKTGFTLRSDIDEGLQEVISFRWDEISSFEISDGLHKQGKEGAFVGALAGGLILGLVAKSSKKTPNHVLGV